MGLVTQDSKIEDYYVLIISTIVDKYLPYQVW